MFPKALKKVVQLLKKNQRIVLLAVVVAMVAALVMNKDRLMKMLPSKAVEEPVEEDAVNSLADVVSNTEPEEEIMNELNNVLNNAVEKKDGNNVAENKVQENFNIADCLAAGGDYESCK